MLTGVQRAKKRINVAKLSIVKAVKIIQKGHSEMGAMEVDISVLCVVLIKLS